MNGGARIDGAGHVSARKEAGSALNFRAAMQEFRRPVRRRPAAG